MCHLGNSTHSSVRSHPGVVLMWLSLQVRSTRKGFDRYLHIVSWPPTSPHLPWLCVIACCRCFPMHILHCPVHFRWGKWGSWQRENMHELETSEREWTRYWSVVGIFGCLIFDWSCSTLLHFRWHRRNNHRPRLCLGQRYADYRYGNYSDVPLWTLLLWRQVR